MKCLPIEIIGNDVKVEYTFDDGTKSTQTVSISSYGGTAKEAAENYGRLYLAELAPVKARELALAKEAEEIVGVAFDIDVNAEPEVKPIV